MKRQLVFDYLRLWKQPCPAPLAKPPAGIKRRDGIPEAPPRDYLSARENSPPPSSSFSVNRVRRDPDDHGIAKGRGRLPSRR